MLKRHIGLITAALLFLICLPLILQINFYQNDDWNRYSSAIRFAHGDFTLLSVTANMYYLQGIIAAVFYTLFHSAHFSLITLVFSVANFYIFYRILTDHTKTGRKLSLILSLIMFFNSLHVYSLLGFMSENIFLTFFLLSIYFYFSRRLITANVFMILGFFVKQVSLVTGLTFMVDLIIKKRFKSALIQLGINSAMLIFYYFIFPSTPEMEDKSFTLFHFTQKGYLIAYLVAISVYLCAFSFPLLISQSINIVSTKKRALLSLIPAILLFLVISKTFNRDILPHGEFPYFGNTFDRAGFWTIGIDGTKNGFMGIFDLYKYWQMASVALALLVLPTLLYRSTRKPGFPIIYIFGYSLMVFLIKDIFDRYFLPLFPVFIVLLMQTKLTQMQKRFLPVISAAFLVFLIFLMYQFSMDFVQTHNYVWDKSTKISTDHRVPKASIMANGAWNKYYGKQPPFSYIFSYDSAGIKPEILNDYVFQDEFKPVYPLNIHTGDSIYLYKRKVI